MKRKKATEELDSPSSSSSPSRECTAKDFAKLKKDCHDKTSSSSHHSDMILEQDRFLPIANISRIMKRVIPSEGKLSKESKECVQECISEFLLFITSEASEKCSTEKRKTITGEDLIVAFQTLGFDDYVEPMKEFLHKYREANKLHNVKTEEPILLGEPSAMSSGHVTNPSVNYLNPDPSQHHQPLVANRAVPNKESQEPAQFTAPSTLQPMQIFFDPATGQHYVAMQGADGVSSLVPVNLTHAG